MRAFFSVEPRATSVVGLMLLAAGLLSGCGGGSNAATLVIVTPLNNTNISLADDVDPATAGVQIDVLVDSTRLTVDDGDITIYIEPSIDRSTFDSSSLTPAGSATLAEDGTATIRVTLADGDYDMIACARGLLCAVRSQVVRITASTGCAAISFTLPAGPIAGRTVLGPEDDEDGTACGETFQTTISVSTDAGDGASVALSVNGVAAGTTSVAGTVATFPAIVLGNRGDTPNTLSVTVTRADGVSCDQDFPGQVMVDCMGVSCTLTQPDTTRAFLNASDDVSAMDGFQADFEVNSDADALGQPIQLVIDGDEGGALSSDPTAGGGGATASFGPVDLTEGLHRAQAICSDRAGNVTRSSVGEWTIDTTPCGVSVTDPAADMLFVDADDVDSSTDGIQINVTGTSTGSDCSLARVGICESTLADATLTADAFSGVATLASSTMQEICAEVEDAAGNIAEARVAVRVRTDAPQIEITTPTAPAAFNSAGDATHGADMDTATPACDAAFSVRCTEVDSAVELVREDTMVVLGTANCDATGGLPAPFLGQANFASVALSSVNAAAGSYNVIARQTADRLTGTSAPLSVVPDCDVPTFTLLRPSACLVGGAAVLRPAGGDDSDPSTPGFQYTVTVGNSNAPPPDVDLRVDGSVVATSTTRSGGSNVFTNQDFTTGGTLAVDACGTDVNGNTGCAPACSVTIVDLPTVNITAPTEGAILDASADCDSGTAGFQVRVQGTTDASAGAGTSATVTINGGAPVTISLTGSSFNACVDAPQGAGLPIVVEVTDSRGSASDTVNVTIDSMPPTTAISDLAVGAATDRRGGTLPFTWTAVADGGTGGALSSYEMRCAKTAITSEADWTAATTFAISTTPGSPTSVEMETVGGFRVGETMYCTMRGSDVTGAMTPIGNDPTVTLDFLEQSVTGSTSDMGWSFAAVGDVNGDTVDDFIVGGVTTAYLFFGSTTSLPTAPAVTFTGFTTNGTIGVITAGLGDFNGDDINDFAFSSGGESFPAGAAYIVYGHDSTTPWPGAVSMAAGGCGADVCLRGTAPSGLSDVQGLAAIGDFNGDGLADIAVGTTFEGFSGGIAPGAAYVVLGSASLSGNVTVPGGAGTLDGFKITSPTGSDFFGNAITSMGDVDGDGRADIVVADVGQPTGHVYIARGRAYTGTGMIDVSSTLIDSGPAIFANRVMNIGDYDGNGQVDLAIFEKLTINRGRVRIYPGSAGAYSAATSFVVTNDTSSPNSDGYGRFLAQGGHPVFGLVGDLDGDGRADALIGSEQRGGGRGSVELYYGQAAGDRNRSQADHSFRPVASTGSTARTSSYIGDVDGDGFSDFAIGDPTGQSGAGEFWIEH
ncbi:MAG: hypothetical protein GXP55_02940 [Deltaproteobacteria bacterium]|nr:hypothetical protein [Deltaproteobacteria bacterium]